MGTTKEIISRILQVVLYICSIIIMISYSLYIVGFIANTDTIKELLPNLNINTIILVLGNFLIALFIAYIINQKVKKGELQIDACFKELNYLLTLLDELRTKISNLSKENHDDVVNRYSSLLLLQSALIKKYKFVDNDHKNKLERQVKKLEQHLTAKPYEIDLKDTRKEMLQIERTVLNTKSYIL